MTKTKKEVGRYFKDYEEHVLGGLKKILGNYEKNVLKEFRKVLSKEKTKLKTEVADLIYKTLKKQSKT